MYIGESMKKKRIEKTKNDAKIHFDSGFHCAESVLSAIAYNHDIESELIPGIATGFCGGMGHTCGSCGAYMGAILGINMALGRKDTSESTEDNYRAVQKLTEEFRDRFGSLNCTELLGHDLCSEEGRSQFVGDNLREIKCAKFTEGAAEIAAKIIEEYKESKDIPL
jgi:C_GCAxxG_C_C family probable redox protein